MRKFITALFVALNLNATTASSECNFLVKSDIQIERYANILGRDYVVNKISAEVKTSVLNDPSFLIKMYPFRCPTRANLESIPAYNYSVRALGEQSSQLYYSANYEIAGNNGFIEFEVYLCKYNSQSKELLEEASLGLAEYFEND